MKLFGQYKETIGYIITIGLLDNSYVALDVNAAWIETFDRGAMEEDSKCSIVVRSGQFEFMIYDADVEGITPDAAKQFICDLGTKNYVNLDDYGFVLTQGVDYPMTVRQELNENDDVIPFAVSMVQQDE